MDMGAGLTDLLNSYVLILVVLAVVGGLGIAAVIGIFKLFQGLFK